jgi:hypothetical protein
MSEVMPQVVSFVTCLGVTGESRPTLHDLFRSLSTVPETFFSCLEFDYSESFSFELRLVGANGQLAQSSEAHLILPTAAGRIIEVVELPLRMAQVLPGGYNLVVFEPDDRFVLAERSLFFGEM